MEISDGWGGMTNTETSSRGRADSTCRKFGKSRVFSSILVRWNPGETMLPIVPIDLYTVVLGYFFLVVASRKRK